MPSTFTDFLQTFMGLKQIQNQTEQVAQQSRNAAVSGVNTFMEMAKHTANPAEQTALVDRFSQLGVASKDQLLGILQHVTPTADAQKDYDVWLGRQAQDSGGTDTTATAAGRQRHTEAANVNATGMNAGQMGTSNFLSDVFSMAPRTQSEANQLASRTATGMSMGAAAVDNALANLPANEVTQAAGVGAGTRMSATQDANNQANWAGLRETNRKNTAESAYQMGTLEVEALRARAAAAGHDPQVINGLLNAKNQILKTIDTTKNPSKTLIMGYIGQLNAINARLRTFTDASGQQLIPTEGDIEYNPDMLVQPGWLARTFGRQQPATNAPRK